MNAMKDEQYCLRWNDHRSILLKNFERLLQTNTSVDCTLAAEGQYLKAHKVVLSACSPYLEAVLNSDVEKHPIVFLKDMKFQELKAIMMYMYRGEVVIPHDQLAGLLVAAESLQIKGLGCGDQVPVSGSKRENITPQIVQQPTLPTPTPPPPPPPALPLKQHLPAIRVTDQTRVQHEAFPQVVDLTDDRAPTPGVLVMRASPDAKRSIAQPAGRNKRMSLPERGTHGNIPSIAVEQISAASPQSALRQAPGSSTYVTQNAFSFANATSVTVAPSTAASPTPKHSALVQKLSTSSGLHKDLAAPQVAPPPQHFEAQSTGVSGMQLADKQLAYKQKVRRPLAQPRLIRSDASRTGQVDRPPVLSPQRASAVGGTNVAVIPEQTPSNRVPEASGAVEHATNVSMQQRSEREKVESDTNAVPTRDSERPPVLSPAVESAAPKAPTTSDTSLNEEAPANREGLAERERAKSATGAEVRRGRPPANARKFKCPECDKKFSTKMSLDRHSRIHDGECFNCDVCDKMFVARAGLVKHMRQHALAAAVAMTVSPPQRATRAVQDTHKCQLCGTACSTASELERHLTDHSLSATEASEDLLAE